MADSTTPPLVDRVADAIRSEHFTTDLGGLGVDTYRRMARAAIDAMQLRQEHCTDFESNNIPPIRTGNADRIVPLCRWVTSWERADPR